MEAGPGGYHWIYDANNFVTINDTEYVFADDIFDSMRSSDA